MKKLIILTGILFIVLSGCTEKIEIELDETYTRLVVDGSITSEPGTHYVILTTSTSYYYNEAPPPVTGADVEIFDNQGNTVNLSELSPGKYATPSDFAAVPGRVYTLDISLKDEINGHSHYTAVSEVYPIGPIDSIGLVHQPNWGEAGFYEVTCYYQDPPTQDFYLFNIYKNGIKLTDTIANNIVSSDEFYNGSYTNGIGVGYLDQAKEREKLNKNDTITFQGCKITEEYYDFIVALQSEVWFQDPLFSGPPANVKGNVSNGAFGFFAAYSVSYATTVFN